ncbi:hypothetical protein, partial [Amycolatopsis circi]|uniref:hypothetical protein n=1 Tax=Amycolatopsis circi TaxID=871959 RepID=UPI001ABFF0B9
MNTSMDDAGRCLLSVAWNIRTGGPRADPRADEVRERLRTVCRGLGHAACRFAAGGGGGDPVPLLRLADRAFEIGGGGGGDPVPLLRLADRAFEIDTLLLLVGTSLIPDSGRDLRWWG